MELKGDAQVLARAEEIERLLLVVCGEEEYPWYVSDEATLHDVCSKDEGEILDRVRATLGVQLNPEELHLPIWKLVDRISGCPPAARLTESVRTAVRDVVRALARGQYGALAEDGRAGRLSAEELERAVREYGRTLVDLPEGAWSLLEVHPQVGSREIALEIPMWTKEEGRSDLTLSVRVHHESGVVRVEIDDLHVL